MKDEEHPTPAPDVAETTPRPSLAPSGRALVYGCFLLSGASALVYEVVWMRQLRLTMGATTSAISTLLAVYMGGLALGAALLGRVADRSRSPLRLYAFLEIAVGLYALALPVLFAWASPLYVSAARAVPDSPALLVALRAAFGAALLLPPTLLMGGTLPVLVRFVGRSEARFGRDLGTLYGANLAGACLGSLAAAYALIPHLGLGGATLSAVVANLLIGALALSWKTTDPREPGAAATPPPEKAPGPLARRDRFRTLLYTTAFVSGFASLGYEILWTRVLLFAFTSTLQAFAVILSTFLAGLALGSVLFAVADRRGGRVRALATALSLGGLLALLLVPLSPRATDIVRSFAAGGEGAVTAGMALAAGLVILAPATLMGFVFPMTSRLLTRDLRHAGRGIGSAYTVNTVGAVLGSLTTGFVLIPALGLKGSLMALAAVQVAMGWALLPWAEGRAAARRLAALSGLGMLAAFWGASSLLRGPNPFDRVPAERIVAHRDGVAASVSVVRNERGGRTLRIDGFETAASDAVAAYMGMMTHIPMLLHPDPHRLLVICFGTGTTAGAGLHYPGARVDVVDIDPNVFAMAGHFRDVNGGVAGDPRARLVVDDGRNFLLTTTGTWDVITSEPMPPVFAGVSSLYSREYYALARRRLKPGGILVQWLPFHLMTPAEAASILRTVQGEFPETTLWVHSLTGIIVARRDAPVRIDTARLRALWSLPGLRGDLARLGVPTIGHFAGLYMLGPAGVRRISSGAPLVTDDFPLLETHAPLWLSGRWNAGRLCHNEAQALEVVYRARLDELLPLDPSPDAERLQGARPAGSRLLLGGLYVDTGHYDLARAEFEAGLGAAADPAERDLFRRALAAVADLRVKAGAGGPPPGVPAP